MADDENKVYPEIEEDDDVIFSYVHFPKDKNRPDIFEYYQNRAKEIAEQRAREIEKIKKGMTLEAFTSRSGNVNVPENGKISQSEMLKRDGEGGQEPPWFRVDYYRPMLI